MKKGLQLSINFIVIIIIAVVLLALGIALLNQFIGGAREIKAELDTRTETQLTELLTGGDQIALPFNRQTVRRGDAHIFGLGILNIEEDDLSWFRVNISFSRAVEKDGITEIPASEVPSADEWFRYDQEPFEIGFNEQRKEVIRLEVPTGVQSGTYVFNVRIFGAVSSDMAGEEQYDVTKKIYVNVP